MTRELAYAQKNEDLSLAVAYRDTDVRSVRAMIIGPPETPYEFGFFEFDMKVGLLAARFLEVHPLTA